MPITEIISNAEALTMKIVAEYPVPVERLWEAYSDPRQIERFWGPEQWPATFTRHDMAVGGRSAYYMTGPDGTRAGGWWKFLKVEPLKTIEVIDGFADESGAENDKLPTMRVHIQFSKTAKGSRFESVTYFPNVEAMEELMRMGVEEGIKSAMGQIDAVLADLKSFASSLPTGSQILNDTQIRVSRVIRGSVADVWRAHHEPALMKRWLLGPDGWTMPVCEIAAKVGDRYRFEWENDDKSQRFGFEGELVESFAPSRAVTTEQMIGVEGPPARNELTLTAVPGGTLLSLVITYPSKEIRDIVLGTGMTTGMETSYARLESEILATA